MTLISLDNFLLNIKAPDERAFLLSEYVSWLILNVGERNSMWYLNRDIISGQASSFCIRDSADATAFKLKFGI